MANNNDLRVDGFTATPASPETAVTVTEQSSSCFAQAKSVKINGVEHEIYTTEKADVDPAHAIKKKKKGQGPNFHNPYEHYTTHA